MGCARLRLPGPKLPHDCAGPTQRELIQSYVMDTLGTLLRTRPRDGDASLAHLARCRSPCFLRGRIAEDERPEVAREVLASPRLRGPAGGRTYRRRSRAVQVTVEHHSSAAFSRRAWPARGIPLYFLSVVPVEPSATVHAPARAAHTAQNRSAPWARRTLALGYLTIPAKVSHLRIDIDVFQEQTNAGRAVRKSTLVRPSQSVKASAP